MSTLANISAFATRWFANVWKFFVGGIVVLVGFSTNFIDLKQPNVAIEITGIEQITSAETDIGSSPDFKALRSINDSLREDSAGKSDLNADGMQRIVERARSRLADAKADFTKLREKLQAALQSPEAPANAEAVRLRGLPLELLNDEDLAKLPRPQLKAAIDQRETRFRNEEEKLALAELEVKNYRERTEKLEAKIVVTVAVSNSGDGATTLKPQALLRTDLGQGNYLDINLRIQGYGPGTSEIKPRSTVVILLESQPIRRMAPDDRERFISFFKNTSPTNLFVADVRGSYYKSNTIPFAQGIYEQKTYDGLKAYAASSRH